MPLTRTPHWAERELHAWLAAHLNDPFVWGQNDCCLMPANAIQAFTGTDLAAAFRGKYTDRASAFALIKSVTGGETVADAAAWCAQEHGLVEYTDGVGKPRPLFAQRGDLVVASVASEAGPLVAGLVHLNGQVVSVSEKGLLRLPITSVVRAWKV